MIIHRHIVRAAARKIEDAASTAIIAYRTDRASYETMVTDRMLGAIEHAMNDYESKGVKWSARTLRPGSGRSAEETRHGADFLGVLDLDLSDYHVKKGFLAQAKRGEPNLAFSRDEWNRLIEQCETMLARTPDAFVFIYSRDAGIRIIPAGSVLGADSRSPLDLYNHGMARFFEDHLKSFIGDRRLSAPTIDALEALARDYDARRVLFLGARDEGIGD